jgi:hypothetical protein
VCAFESKIGLIHDIKPGTAVGELNVGENQAGTTLFGDRDRFRMSTRNPGHAMTKALFVLESPLANKVTS